MNRSIKILAAAALGAVFGLSAADAQTVRRHVHHPAAVGRQIIVHPLESYLTLGEGASPLTYHGLSSYALDTVSGYPWNTPPIDHTTVGQRGLERLPNNFTVPGCCVP